LLASGANEFEKVGYIEPTGCRCGGLWLSCRCSDWGIDVSKITLLSSLYIMLIFVFIRLHVILVTHFDVLRNISKRNQLGGGFIIGIGLRSRGLLGGWRNIGG